MEIITGVARRRHWRLEEKLRIVAEVEEPGASFGAVARRHDVSRGLLWNWRRQVRSGSLVSETAPMFTPVRITAELASPIAALTMAPTAEPHSGVPTSAASDRIEITLADGTCVRVGADIGLATLRRVMAAVRR